MLHSYCISQHRLLCFIVFETISSLCALDGRDNNASGPACRRCLQNNQCHNPTHFSLITQQISSPLLCTHSETTLQCSRRLLSPWYNFCKALYPWEDTKTQNNHCPWPEGACIEQRRWTMCPSSNVGICFTAVIHVFVLWFYAKRDFRQLTKIDRKEQENIKYNINRREKLTKGEWGRKDKMKLEVRATH